jgi:hypothetical protein
MQRSTARGAEAPGSDATPMSAARLAAEAAFGPAPFATAQPPSLLAQVTVRRARGTPMAPVAAPAAMAEDGANVFNSASNSATNSATNPATNPATDSAADSAITKSPRVFRIEAAPAPDTLAPDSLVLQAASNGHDGAAHQRLSGPRRAASDKRPGPVLHVVHALPPRHEPPAQPLRLDALSILLARVDPVLTEIKRAQAFQFVDDSLGGEWQRLARVADGIRLTLNMMLR